MTDPAGQPVRVSAATFTDRQCVRAYLDSAPRSPTGRTSADVAAQMVTEETGVPCSRFRVRKAIERWRAGKPDPYHGGVVSEKPREPGFAPTIEALKGPLGRDPATIGRHVRSTQEPGYPGEPFPAKVPGKGYPVEACKAWYRRNIDGAYGSRETVGERNGQGDDAGEGAGAAAPGPTPIDRKRAVEAELAEMRLAEKRGELVSAAVVSALLEMRTRRLAHAMHKWVDEFAPRLASTTSTGAAGVLREFIDRGLRSYADGDLLAEAREEAA